MPSRTLIAISSEGGHNCPSMHPPKLSRCGTAPVSARAANRLAASRQAWTDRFMGVLL